MSLTFGQKAEFWLLTTLSHKPPAQGIPEETGVAIGNSKLEKHFGASVWDRFLGKRVLDFGCGAGSEAVAIAKKGAAAVYGIDIQRRCLDAAVRLAVREGVESRCVFLDAHAQRDEIKKLYGNIDCILSIDSFEHFRKPDEILDEMYALLAPGGCLLVSFGPPWKHPYGGHMWFFSSIPWMHYIFREETIMSVRALYRTDGAKRFEDVEGGLNRMTVARFLQLIEKCGFRAQLFQPVPVKGLTFLTRWPWSREYFTSLVRCHLTKPNARNGPSYGAPAPKSSLEPS